MKNISVFISIIIFLGCSPKENTDEKIELSDSNIEETQALIEEKKELEEQQNSDFDECVFDMKTQTSDFLNEIKEFENYLWIDSLKMAMIPLGNGDTIEVNRGGCDH